MSSNLSKTMASHWPKRKRMNLLFCLDLALAEQLLSSVNCQRRRAHGNAKHSVGARSLIYRDSDGGERVAPDLVVTSLPDFSCSHVLFFGAAFCFLGPTGLKRRSRRLAGDRRDVVAKPVCFGLPMARRLPLSNESPARAAFRPPL